jgi:hypothetical protein
MTPIHPFREVKLVDVDCNRVYLYLCKFLYKIGWVNSVIFDILVYSFSSKPYYSLLRVQKLKLSDEEISTCIFNLYV